MSATQEPNQPPAPAPSRQRMGNVVSHSMERWYSEESYVLVESESQLKQLVGMALNPEDARALVTRHNGAVEELAAACDVAEENHKAFAAEHTKIATALGMPTHAREQDILDRIGSLIARAQSAESECVTADVVLREWKGAHADLAAENEKLRQSTRHNATLPAWEGMESAPKDGSRVVVCSPDDGVTTAYCDRDGIWVIYTDNYQVYHATTPTHWQPLPPAPLAAYEALKGKEAR